MPLDALLLDVDGTLVESNGAHIVAWQRAFREAGHEVAGDHIQPQVGKGGDFLVAAVLGPSVEKEHGNQLRAAYKRHFLEIAATTKFHVVPGAETLIQAAKARGLRVALATSSERDILEAVEESCGTKFSALVDLVTTSSDADQSKPAPDLLLATAEKLGLTPAQCALVGDTVHDATACRRSGSLLLGVESGGNSTEKLLEAGARAAWKDVGRLAQDLEHALQLASPIRIRLTNEALEELMDPALEAARAGLEAGEAPIGAALFDGDGCLLASGHNEMQGTQNKTAHAEIMTFARAAGKAPLDSKDLILVSTLEPCVMCTAAAMEAGVDTVIFGLMAPYDSGSGRVQAPRSPESRMPRLVGDIRAAESRELLEEYLRRKGDTPETAYVRQLLTHED